MVVEVDSSVWLGIYSSPCRVGTQALVQYPLVLALVPDHYPEVGRAAPAHVQNPGTGRLVQGASPLGRAMEHIRSLDLRVPRLRAMMMDQVQHLTQTIGIVAEILLTTGPLTPSDVTDEVITSVRGIEIGIEMAKGGTTTLGGTIRNLINHHPLGSGLPPLDSPSDLNMLPLASCVPLSSAFIRWYNHEKKS